VFFLKSALVFGHVSSSNYVNILSVILRVDQWWGSHWICTKRDRQTETEREAFHATTLSVANSTQRRR